MREDATKLITEANQRFIKARLGLENAYEFSSIHLDGFKNVVVCMYVYVCVCVLLFMIYVSGIS